MKQNICHKEIKLILLDLDGTLLTTGKKIFPANYAALEQAATKGIHIVPCTGSFFSGMPEKVPNLPFLHYAITINGTEIYDMTDQPAMGEVRGEWIRKMCTTLNNFRQRSENERNRFKRFRCLPGSGVAKSNDSRPAVPACIYCVASRSVRFEIPIRPSSPSRSAGKSLFLQETAMLRCCSHWRPADSSVLLCGSLCIHIQIYSFAGFHHLQ